MPPAFHHLAIHCADLERCERFYREVLGLPVVRRWPRPEGGDRSVWLGLGGEAFLALERAEGAPEVRTWRDSHPGLHLVALRIGAGERTAWEARLAGAGVPVVHRTRWTIYLHDPEGNRLGLSHHPEDAALVDPGDPDVALALAAEHGLRPRWIVHTHGHADHSGGSAALRERGVLDDEEQALAMQRERHGPGS